MEFPSNTDSKRKSPPQLQQSSTKRLKTSSYTPSSEETRLANVRAAYDDSLATSKISLEIESTAENESEQSFSTKWNSEFQTYLEMPTQTCWERLERARKMSTLYELFINTATEIGKIIIVELSIASQSKTISRVPHARGIAGGEKYCNDGIFFKLATDPYALYGGDHFSMKAAGHEIKSCNELLECTVCGLHWPMMTIIDFYGYRLVAEAALPISRSSLKYGSDDGCKTIHNSSAELSALIDQAADQLGLKRHVAGKGLAAEPRVLAFPADVEGHLGADGRFYLVDIQRLFPAESDFKLTYGVVIPTDEKKEMELVILDRTKYSDEISRVLGEHVHWVEQAYPEHLTVFYSAQPSPSSDPFPLNQRATCITKTSIYGDALSVLGEVAPSTREVLFYMLRPEWIRKNHPIKVSSDAFTNFGADNREEHEKEILILRHRLVHEKIPEFAMWLVKNNHAVISSLHLSKILHEHGINLRYVGLLYMLVPESSPRLKYNVIGFNMLARVIKDLLQAKLRAVTFESIESYRKAIVDFFNIVLGDGPESDLFWQISIPVHLLHKFAPFGFQYNREKDNFQGLLGHLILYQLLQEYTGVIFHCSVENLFLPLNVMNRGPKPLKVEDLDSISVKIKRCRMELLPFIEKVCKATNEPNSVQISDLQAHAQEDKELLEKLKTNGIDEENCNLLLKEVQYRRQYLQLTQEIFGKNSAEEISSTFRLSDIYSECGEHYKARATAIEGMESIIVAGDLSGEILLSCVYILGVVLELSGPPYLELACVVYNIVLTHMEELFDSKYDKDSASPFEVKLHQRLMQLERLNGNKEAVEVHQREIDILLRVFHMPLDELLDLGRKMIDKFLKHENLSGIKLNYREDLQTLLAQIKSIAGMDPKDEDLLLIVQ